MGRMDGKVALIMGGAGGMGAASAKLFSKEGAKVAIADFKVKEGEAVAKEINDNGGNAIFIGCDLSQKGAAAKVVKATLDAFGEVNVYLHWAAIAVPAAELKLWECSRETWDKIIAVNLTGVYEMVHELAPVMIAQNKPGSIMLCGSIAGLWGWPMGDAYTAAKGGVISITRSLATELGKYNIRVNCICPGCTATPIVTGSTVDMDYHELEKVTVSSSCGMPEGLIALDRWAKAEEQAYVALHLCSDEASYVTGVIMPVDGGWTLV